MHHICYEQCRVGECTTEMYAHFQHAIAGLQMQVKARGIQCPQSSCQANNSPAQSCTPAAAHGLSHLHCCISSGALSGHVAVPATRQLSFRQMLECRSRDTCNTAWEMEILICLYMAAWPRISFDKDSFACRADRCRHAHYILFA